MARDQEVGVKVTADTKKAQREISAFERGLRRTKDSAERLGKIVRGAGLALAGFTASLVGSLKLAGDTEQNVANLAAALERLGPAASATQEALIAQANALQRTTTVTSDAAIQTQALLADLGVTAEQLPQATQAAVDLSAALGISLEQAARNLGRTTGGLAGELQELVPELRGLSEEALRNGDAIRLVAELYEGRAAVAADTLAGRLTQLRNELADTAKAFGIGLAGTNDATEAIAELTRVVRRNQDAIRTWGRGLRQVFGLIADGVQFLADLRLSFLGLDDALKATEASNAALANRAVELGITVEELERRLKEARRETREFNRATEDQVELAERAAPVLATEADLVKLWTEEANRLAKELDEVNDEVDENTKSVARNIEVVEREVELIEREVQARQEFIGVIQTEVAIRGDFARQAAERRSGVNFDRTSIGRRIGTNDPIFGGLSGGAFSVSRTRAVANPDGTVSFI